MKKLIVPVMLGLIILIPFAVNFTITPEAAAMSLDDEDEDMEDFENYIKKAEKAADSENFSKAKKYLKKAAKFGIGKKQLKKARNYLSKKRKARKNRLARQERERQERNRRARNRRASSSSSGGSSSGGSSSGNCRNMTTLWFECEEGTFITGACTGSQHTQITSMPSGVYVDSNSGKSVIVQDYSNGKCVRGNYGFTYSAKIGMGCDRRVSYSGSFYIDGTHRTYYISIYKNNIDIYPTP